MTLAVDAAGARRTADAHRARVAGRDAHFAPWASAATGDPVLVHTMEGHPSYWVVPIEAGAVVIGFVRVLGDGRVSATGALYRDAGDLRGCPAVVTGVTAEEARAAVASTAGLELADVPAPNYVHDGPPGREAWLVEWPGSSQRFFVTRGGVEERPAGGG